MVHRRPGRAARSAQRPASVSSRNSYGGELRQCYDALAARRTLPADPGQPPAGVPCATSASATSANSMTTDTRSLARCSQFVSADNMTDQFAALATLVAAGQPRKRASARRFPRALAWRSTGGGQVAVGTGIEPIAGRHPGGRAGACWLHPAFDLHNPNKVYALVNTFGNNHVRFHAADGSGYCFLAEQIAQLERQQSTGCRAPGQAFRSLAPVRRPATGARARRTRRSAGHRWSVRRCAGDRRASARPEGDSGTSGARLPAAAQTTSAQTQRVPAGQCRADQ
jgi:hypothetical protein